MLPKTIEASWEKAHAVGGEASRINRFTLQSTVKKSLPNVILPPLVEPPSYSHSHLQENLRLMFRTKKSTNWISRNVLHLQHSTIGSTYFKNKQKCVPCLTIHLMPCRGFAKLRPVQNDDLSTSFSPAGKHHPNFETLDAKIATA